MSGSGGGYYYYYYYGKYYAPAEATLNGAGSTASRSRTEPVAEADKESALPAGSVERSGKDGDA